MISQIASHISENWHDKVKSMTGWKKVISIDENILNHKMDRKTLMSVKKILCRKVIVKILKLENRWKKLLVPVKKSSRERKWAEKHLCPQKNLTLKTSMELLVGNFVLENYWYWWKKSRLENYSENFEAGKWVKKNISVGKKIWTGKLVSNVLSRKMDGKKLVPVKKKSNWENRREKF